MTIAAYFSCYYKSCFNHYNRLLARWALVFLVACHITLLLHVFCYHYVFSLWWNKYADDDDDDENERRGVNGIEKEGQKWTWATPPSLKIRIHAAWNSHEVWSRYTAIRYRLLTLTLLKSYVTLWPWALTFWHASLIMYPGSCDQSRHQLWVFYDYRPTISRYDGLHLIALVVAAAVAAYPSYYVTYESWVRNSHIIFEIIDPVLCSFYADLRATKCSL